MIPHIPLSILERVCYEKHLPYWSGFIFSLSEITDSICNFLFAIVWFLHISRSMLFVFIHGAWSHWRRKLRAWFGWLELAVQTAYSRGTGRGVMEAVRHGPWGSGCKLSLTSGGLAMFLNDWSKRTRYGSCASRLPS
ncbi:Uncharacterized protein HZ326_11708 [Fusarium oxysporum f. sp. albedinis]|nr:Uncharacterized protein HZ326_11708 [Fusarium oxysporum f. sp. albedinis]